MLFHSHLKHILFPLEIFKIPTLTYSVTVTIFKSTLMAISKKWLVFPHTITPLSPDLTNVIPTMKIILNVNH